ncbi:hypothetical protein PC39_12269 [Salinisphaera sp. PC39]|uniref:tetratricopeptide repeat protein n=1 Tax=Salinisphaera sp. PC39 TaxID=1304156 RepID=UPI0033428F90
MTARRAHIAVCLALLTPGAAAADYEPPGPGRAAALERAELRYLAATGDPLAFLAAAHDVDGERGGPGPFLLDALLGEHLAAYGLLDAAAERYRRGLDYRVDTERRNRAWFELARAWHHRGRPDRAETALDNVHGELPGELEGRKPLLEAQALIAQGRFADAVETLRAVEGDLTPYARYNLGVALVRAGRVAEGAGELNAVGTMRTDDPVGLALRDQANLVLAYAYLETGQGATARALFQRIRLNGPAADRALLGLGWAELAPDGDPQKHTVLKEIACREDPARLLPDTLPVLRRMPREACGPPQMFRDTDRFRTKEGGETEAERYRRALVPWLELVHRPATAAPVQEAWTTVPHAYAELGSRERALDYYSRAIHVLEDERAGLETVIERLRDPVETGAELPPGVAPDLDWFARRWGLPRNAAMPYLHDAISRPGFNSDAHQIQDLIALDDRLLDRGERLGELQATLQGRRTALARAGIDAPAPLREQEVRVRELQTRLRELRTHIRDLIADYGKVLRDRMLAAARERARYLDSYLTNSRLGQASVIDALGGHGTAPARTSQP